MRKQHFLVLIIGLILFLAGCAPVVDTDQVSVSDTFYKSDSSTTIAQSFVSQFSGLNGVEIYLKPDVVGEGRLVASLKTDRNSLDNLAQTSLDLSEIAQPGYYPFSFSIPKPEPFSSYYLTLSVEGNGSVLAGSGGKAAYLDGSLYQGDSPVEAQMTFKLTYAPEKLLGGLLREFVSWGYQFLLSLLIFLVPGLALVNILWPASKKLSVFERAAIAIGVSIVIYPILILWTNVLGIHLGSWYAWLPFILGTGYLLWSNRIALQDILRRPVRENWTGLLKTVKTDHFGENLTLLVVLFLIFFVRFWVVRALPGPMWGDSLQHTMMAQLIVDNNGLFQSWRPYAELSTFTYHFGFHSAVAVYHWISGKEVMDSVLWVGQFLNGFSVFMLYPLVLSFERKNRWGGVTAVAVAGLLMTFPMFLVNWGRYTQLAGMVTLPAFIVCAIAMVKQEKLDLRLILLTAICLLGLALTHYRVLILGLLILPLFIVFFLKKGSGKKQLNSVLLSCLSAFILFLPWFINIFNGRYDEATGAYLSVTSSGLGLAPFIEQFSKYYPRWIWFLCGGSLIYALLRRKTPIIIFGVWASLIFLTINPGWVGLPGDGIIDDLSVYIIFFIPTTIIISFFLGDIVKFIQNRLSSLGTPVIIVLFLSIAIFGFNNQRKVVDQHQFAYLTWPDLHAMAWIEENIPKTSKILVKFEYSYSDLLVSGIDSGWWIPYFTERATNLPPLTYGSELGFDDSYFDDVMGLAKKISGSKMGDPGLVRSLLDQGYEYIFLGNHPLRPTFPITSELFASPFYELVYDTDNVRIFKILKP